MHVNFEVRQMSDGYIIYKILIINLSFIVASFLCTSISTKLAISSRLIKNDTVFYFGFKLNCKNNSLVSLSIFISVTFPYFWVWLIFEWPSIFEVLSIETPFSNKTLVAKVCLARWLVKFFSIPQNAATSFKLALYF